MTVPPPPHGGDRPDIRGGDYKGGEGVPIFASANNLLISGVMMMVEAFFTKGCGSGVCPILTP